MNRPTIPLAIKQQLRQETFFGCARCGNPILDYHHIVPWSERQHFEPEHMIALCPTCHRHIGKIHRDNAYELKETPYNQKMERFEGELGTDTTITSFKVGSILCEDTPTIFSYFGIPILGYVIINDQICVNARILGKNGWPEILIQNNDIWANSSAFWDIEHRTNYLRFQKQKNQTFFEIDLRKQPALISAKFQFGEHKFDFSPQETNINDNVKIKSGSVKNSLGALSFGNGKLHLPNYGMLNPHPILEDRSKLYDFQL